MIAKSPSRADPEQHGAGPVASGHRFCRFFATDLTRTGSSDWILSVYATL
jgi:hypothetical protein